MSAPTAVVAPSASSGPARTLDVHAVVDRPLFHLDVRLTVNPGEVLAVVGPNGAGKSTLLNCVAGLVPLSAGHIRLGAAILDDPATGRFRPPADRCVGVVFQDYRLFGGLSVEDNVAFAARARGSSRSASRRAARRWLDQFDLVELRHRRPGELSGGQAQRVALARALAADPALLLLDEPLAALDSRSRLDVQAMLRTHVRSFAGPTVLITHDPVDALVLADRVVVIEGGRVVQHGSAAQVAQRPATAYVASMLGLNLYRGSVRDGRMVVADGAVLVVTGTQDGNDVLAAVRPAAFTVHRERPDGLSARNIWPVRVDQVVALADRMRLHCLGMPYRPQGPTALVDVTFGAAAELQLAPGAHVWLSSKATDVLAYPASPPMTKHSG